MPAKLILDEKRQLELKWHLFGQRSKENGHSQRGKGEKKRVNRWEWTAYNTPEQHKLSRAILLPERRRQIFILTIILQDILHQSLEQSSGVPRLISYGLTVTSQYKCRIYDGLATTKCLICYTVTSRNESH